MKIAYLTLWHLREAKIAYNFGLLECNRVNKANQKKLLTLIVNMDVMSSKDTLEQDLSQGQDSSPDSALPIT